ncbi:hypothetical protein CEE37_10545 [candidate division LCP-89 bacterium B3_LCP]|uniref:Outer membrane protein beta-barrel domain-containing protein n=1 Tax=candidate division LCP-89 bacterium B3_LCP TaxID=2012998 RepID=A0A532UXT0_UNCL8|nr:MAG: hypothetical protein CEE37_10545 [candidate division LCP-89 bacterium B3_LCP]
MKKAIILLSLFVIAYSASAHEITGEISIGFIDPYDRLAPGFCGSFTPEYLEGKWLSLGAGLALNISNRFNYETTPADSIPGFSDWWEFEERLVELVNFDFFLEGRLKFFGHSEDAHWKGWLTLNSGVIIQSSSGIVYITQFEVDAQDNIIDMLQYTSRSTNKYRTDLYLTPGVLIGIGNFVVGYKQWFYPGNSVLELGKPGQTLGTFRIGYRFIW